MFNLDAAICWHAIFDFGSGWEFDLDFAKRSLHAQHGRREKRDSTEIGLGVDDPIRRHRHQKTGAERKADSGFHRFHFSGSVRQPGFAKAGGRRVNMFWIAIGHLAMMEHREFP